MRDIGDGWGTIEESPRQVARYCRQCQEILIELRGVPHQCPTCRCGYSPNDPRTYRGVREFRLFRFSFPAILATFALGTVSMAVAFNSTRETTLTLLAGFPAPLGLVAGYINRPMLLVFFQIVTAVIFGLATAAITGTSWATSSAFFTAILTLFPVGLGYLLGLLIRHLLMESRWSQRFFF
jgi:hypothetical protein